MNETTTTHQLPTEINLNMTYIEDDNNNNTTDIITMRINKTRRIQRIVKGGIQGDTGANCSATNDKSLLWDYKELEQPIPIITYNDESEEKHSFEATGTGIIKMIVQDTTMNWLALYTPTSTGTIISPDRYMMDNIQVHEFQQTGKRDGKGYIQFTDTNGHLLSQLDMKRSRDGLWYVENPLLLPPVQDTRP
jgi:hypothetical protein